ncbi:uncharacterized protein Z520_05596 [Fonsecaea multimorphosa CBS 102226]|uniref:Trimethylguanosine synthase n=1 Tax=Fonsecaea multimorphosa CBS 102226 TaxID=1442371 RepID=A0A0D2H8V4_9EURO|nr:uncharacterized protein Z520_05596 [Fonsecaea multimorphosa CBS 102226]KIX98295.1 hypothetical protein Z520_05596 [Fonsecaea multimorphosa CBS 102226]OAL24944.1 hypothetical protein AYO22_05280 [Fonsecaea multimorphosa]
MGKKRKNAVPVEHDYEPPPKKRPLTTPLPEGVHHYESIEEVPWDIQKYWHQGYSIFSKYDDGIWMTDGSWYEVTHESVANTIAQHMAEAVPEGKSIIFDVMCGVGGNTIAFALSGKWKRVYAIEKDAATLACAKHNAEIYGVADRITWFQGDCFEILGLDETKKENTVEALKTIASTYGVIFASPPWGGPGYREAEVFDLEAMQPYPFSHLYESFKKLTPNVVLYLPRTSDLRQIAKVVGEDKRTQIVHYCTKGSSRALCAYLGDWASLKL